MNEFVTLMKPELVITIIIFLLLFIKLGKGIKNDLLLSIIQNLLLLNLAIGFFFNAEGTLFDNMYHTTKLIVFQKSILNFGVYVISLLFAGWFKKTEHLAEFFMLMLSALLGLDFLISSGNFLIDADGELLAPPKTEDTGLMTINGWDEAKTERAARDNAARIKLFQKMIADWGEGLAKRVKEVNIADLQEPQATVEDSGSRIAITLARDDLSKSLKSAIEAVAGKGERVRSVNAAGVYPVLEYVGAN